MIKIEFGIDQLLQHPPAWQHKRLGLVTNAAAQTNTGISTRKALLDAGFNLVQLFSPEHGLMATGADGAPMPHGTDALTGLPITSLYGEKLAPSNSDLQGIDLLLFDIPDAGLRFYTYLWTLSYLLEACAQAHKKLVVLDRPNPLSGAMDAVEGPRLAPGITSFIGRWDIPIRHSATLGELARYFVAEKNLGTALEVIPCKGWEREAWRRDWGLPYVAPSPALVSDQAMETYPALCFVEATNLSEGRGTPLPFSWVGAPWLKATALKQAMDAVSEGELGLELLVQTPSSGKWAGQACSGLVVHLTDRQIYRPVFWGLLLLRCAKDLHPQHFQWQAYPTQVNPSGKKHLDKLLGQANTEDWFDWPLPQFLQQLSAQTRCSDWPAALLPYLLY